MRLTCHCWSEGSENSTVRHCFSKFTKRFNYFNVSGVVTANVTCNCMEFTIILSRFAGRQFTVVAAVCNFISQNGIANKSLFLCGYVAKTGKAIRDMNWLVVCRGFLFRTTLPPHRHPAILFSLLLGTSAREELTVAMLPLTFEPG